MAKFSNRDDAYSSEEDEEHVENNAGGEEEDEEELEAVARSSDSDEEAVPEESPVSDDEIAPIEDDYEVIATKIQSTVDCFAYCVGILCLQDEEDDEKVEISKREKARLREMQKVKKQKLQEMLESQNASIDADMVRCICIILWFLGIEESDLFTLIQNNKGKGRLKFLLQQTELFAHFAKGDASSSSSQKKVKGRCVGCY